MTHIPTKIPMKNIAVIGSGAWGTALAIHMARLGHRVHLYCRRAAVAHTITTTCENSEYLPGVSTGSVIATTDTAPIHRADMVFIVTPSQHMQHALVSLPIAQTAQVILCCKGICANSLQPLSTVAQQYYPHISVLSGPTFAIEVAKQYPTAITLAGDTTAALKPLISSPYFRVYETPDRIGACVYGACKNVLAIACGISVGKNLGDNAKASLITRGVAEISRLNIACGGQSATAQQLCGFGDIVLTCSSVQSRNMSFGIALGQGASVAQLLKSRKTVTEGVINAKILQQVAEKYNTEMPICNAVYHIINGHISVDTAIEKLLQR